MSKNLVCSDCGDELESGFILEEIGFTPLPTGASHWVEGKPEFDFFNTVKLNGKRKYYIKAYRCKSCGLLKLYADRNLD